MREDVDGEDRIILDPHSLSSDHTVSVSLRDISQDGKIIAYALREGGVDEVSIRFMDIDSGKEYPDVLPPARYGEVVLTPDNKGVYYERYGDVPPMVMYHELGSDTLMDVKVFHILKLMFQI